MSRSLWASLMKHLQGLVEEREPSYFAAFSLFVGAVIALEMVCLEYKDLRNLGMISLMRNLVALELDFHGSKSF